MNVVSSLAAQMTSNIGAGMMSSMGGSGIAIQAVNMFTEGQSKGKDVAADWVPPPGRNLQPADAYDQIKPVVGYLVWLKSLLTKGDDGGVDWDSITSPKGSILDFIMTMMDDLRAAFQHSGSPTSGNF